MSELGRPFLHPDVRRLIEVDRAAPDPPGVVKRKVAQQIDRSLGLGGAMLASLPDLVVEPPPLHDSVAPSVPAPPAGIFGWKAVAGAAVALVIGGAALLSWSGHGRSRPTGDPRANAAPVVAAALPGPTAGTDIWLDDSQTSPPTMATAPAVGVPEAARARGLGESNALRGSVRHRARAAQPPAALDTLAAERIVLDGARASLVHHDAAGALAALRAHEQSFPRGQLLEERESMRVQALALAHDFNAARATGDKFRRRFPHSMFLPAVERALDAAP
jgi:hypothetical protein